MVIREIKTTAGLAESDANLNRNPIAAYRVYFLGRKEDIYQVPSCTADCNNATHPANVLHWTSERGFPAMLCWEFMLNYFAHSLSLLRNVFENVSAKSNKKIE